MHALTVSHLTVHFDGAERPALDDVSFTLEPGQIAMVVGPNGSGKTTLLRAILGLLPATGTVHVFGQPLKEALSLIGYVPQHLRFDPTLPMTAREILRMPLQCLRRKARRTPLDWTIDTFQLADFLDQQVGTLSGGQLKRLLLARAMIHHSRLLLLDEPEAGVDAGGTQALYQLLGQLVHQGPVLGLRSEVNVLAGVGPVVVDLYRDRRTFECPLGVAVAVGPHGAAHSIARVRLAEGGPLA